MLLKMTFTLGFSVVSVDLNTVGGALWSVSKNSVGVFLGSRGSSVVDTSVVVNGRNLFSLDRDLVT